MCHSNSKLSFCCNMLGIYHGILIVIRCFLKYADFIKSEFEHTSFDSNSMTELLLNSPMFYRSTKTLYRVIVINMVAAVILINLIDYCQWHTTYVTWKTKLLHSSVSNGIKCHYYSYIHNTLWKWGSKRASVQYSIKRKNNIDVDVQLRQLYTLQMKFRLACFDRSEKNIDIFPAIKKLVIVPFLFL